MVESHEPIEMTELTELNVCCVSVNTFTAKKRRCLGLGQPAESVYYLSSREVLSVLPKCVRQDLGKP